MEFVQFLYTNSFINKKQFLELKGNKEDRKIGDLLIAKKILPRQQVLEQLNNFVRADS